MSTPIEPIGTDADTTMQPLNQQRNQQAAYTTIQQQKAQGQQQQQRQAEIAKVRREAAARSRRAKGLTGWGANVKGDIPPPRTPMLAERLMTMGPRDGSAPAGESLAENVAAEEQVKLAEFMRGEARRAVEEEQSISHAHSVRAHHLSMQAMAEQRAKEQEAWEAYKEYSEQYAEAARNTDVTYSDYIKAFKGGQTTAGYDDWKQPYIQQELFKVQYPDIAGQMDDLERISQKMADEGWGEAYREYGDVAPRITRLQETIQQEKGLTPEQAQPLNAWLSDVSAQNVAANRQFAADKSARATLRKIQDALNATPPKPDPLVDPGTGLRIVKAGTPLRTSDYPAPPSSTPLYDAAVERGLITAPIVGGTERIQAAGTEWIEGNRASTHRVVDQLFPGGGVPKAVAGGMAEIGAGGWRALLGIQGMGLAVPAAEYAVRRPGEFSAALVPGSVKFAEDLATHATRNPLQFGGELAAGALIFHGGAKLTSRAAAPLSSRITEFGIKVRTPAPHRPAVSAVSDIGRNVPGLRSTVEVDPDLSRILNVGKAAPEVEAALIQQPHTIYGSATQLGQMPAKRIPATPKDLDVFVSDPKAFNVEMVTRLGPEYSIEGNIIRRQVPGGKSPHAIDTHQFPAGYPISPSKRIARVVYGEEKIAPDLPFDFMPKEVLKAGRLTQEYLYTQVQRKATSVMGEPESRFRWKFGPPEHRMKDISTLIADTEWLVESTRQRMPKMGFIERTLAGRKVRKLDNALGVLRRDPMVQGAMKAPLTPEKGGEIPIITVISRPPRTRPSRGAVAAPITSSTAASRFPEVLSPRRPVGSSSPTLRQPSGRGSPIYSPSRYPGRPTVRSLDYITKYPSRRPPVYPSSHPPNRPPSRPPIAPPSRPPVYPFSHPPNRPPSRPPIAPPSRPPVPPPTWPPGYPPQSPPPAHPPLITLTPKRGRRPWRFGKYRRREVLAPIATPWELLGVEPPAEHRREAARIARSRPQHIFVSDQRRLPTASRRQASTLEKMLSTKKRKKSLFW